MSDARLDGPAQTAAGAPPAFARCCLWCGAPVASLVAEAEFCGTPCRKAFNNLRAMRGAEFYDLFMALRHDRAVATRFKVWRLLNRLAAIFRAEDKAERAGRMSWRSPAAILARRPYLAAERLTSQGRGR